MAENMSRQKLIVLSTDSQVMQAAATVAGRHYEVLRSAESARALAWVQNSPSVAVVVVDQELRGTTGIEVLKQIQELRPSTRRVLLTAMDTLESLVDALHSGVVQHFVQKPVQGAELLRVLASKPLPRVAAA